MPQMIAQEECAIVCSPRGSVGQYLFKEYEYNSSMANAYIS